MASSVSIIDPDMTSEVSVQASNFGADVPFGPIVVSTISKSGSDNYHGEAYFDARNSVLNANDWQDNHQGVPQGAQSYYYPGGNFGGPIPGTHKHSSSGAAMSAGSKTRATPTIDGLLFPLLR